ncbi:MAG: c-type cytochrome [Dokdonella sp.]
MARTRCTLISGLLAAGCLLVVPASASEELATRAGCTICHAGAAKTLGPAYKDIAARYRGDPTAPALLAERVRKGSSGVWGPIPMMATPVTKMSDAEIESVLAWILAI